MGKKGKLSDIEYRMLIQKVFLRDGFKCRHCGFRGNLHAHHIVYRSHQGPNEENNLITLCNSCHRGIHDGKLKLDILQVLEYDVVVKFTRKEGWKPQ